MKPWPRLAAVAGLGLMATIAGALAAAGQPTPPGAPAAGHGEHGTPAGWKFSWPKGDPAKGRDVFRKLECYSCHVVLGQSFPTATERDKLGPELSAMGPLHEPEYFAEAIINPSAVVQEGKGYEAGDGSSKMPSYNDAVTVQEVIDLVAFLHSLTPPATPPADRHDRHH